MMWIRKTWMNLMHRHWAIQGGHLMLFFPLHPSILEPDLNLSLRHQQGMSNFYPPAACQVAIKMKFFLQFKSLVSGVGCMCPLFFTLLIYCVWIWNKKLNINFWKYSSFAFMWLGNFSWKKLVKIKNHLSKNLSKSRGIVDRLSFLSSNSWFQPISSRKMAMPHKGKSEKF